MGGDKSRMVFCGYMGVEVVVCIGVGRSWKLYFSFSSRISRVESCDYWGIRILKKNEEVMNGDSSNSMLLS